MPKISVIMPAYNAEKYISEAIDSILNQSFPDFELIVINDCSWDSTEEIIMSYRDDRLVYLKNEENLGVAKTLNRGLSVAKGEYIARMDADDISMPDRFLHQIRYMDGNPECGICGSNIMVFGENVSQHLVVYAQKDVAIRADQLFNSPFAHPAIMLRKSVLVKAGEWYDYTYEKAEDYELWYRILAYSKGYNIQQALLRYRHHGKQVTVTCKREQREALALLHQRMLNDLGVSMTDAQFDVFLRLCAGERCFSKDEYMVFVRLGQEIIAAADGYSKAVKSVFASLNMQIKEKSNLEENVYFSIKEPVYGIYRKIRRQRSS